MKPANISIVIGRDAELEAIVNAWRAGAPGVVVTATPGMGRTTLCVEAAAAIRAAGADVIELRPTPTSQRVGLGALAPALIDRAQGLDLRDEVHHALQERIAAGRVALVVDDAHVLDASSAALVADIVDAAACGATAFVVLSAPDGASSILVDHPDLSRLRLAPLADEALAAVLTFHGVDPTVGLTGVSLTDGNPGSVLRRVTGEHRARLGTLAVAPVASGAARDLVETLAVAGRLTPVAAQALEVAGALTDAVAAGLARITTTDGAFFATLADPGLASDVRVALPALRLRSLLRAVLAATDPAERSSDFVDLAVRSGVQVARDDLRAAARHAHDAHEDAALNLARAAAQDGDETDVAHWITVAMERSDDVELDLALAAGDERTSPRARTAAAHVELWRRSDPAAAISRLDSTDAADVAARAEILALTGDADGAIAAAGSLSESEDEAVRHRATTALGLAHRQRGEAADAVRAFEHERPARHRPTRAVDDLAPMVHTISLLDVGRWRDAEPLAVNEYRAALRVESPVRRARAAIIMAVVAVERGLVDDAARHANAAVGLLATSDRAIECDWAIIAAAMAAAMSGDQDAGRLLLSSRRTDHSVVTAFAGFEARARAWCEPDTATACDDLARAAQRLAAAGDVGAAASCLHDLAIRGDARRAVMALEQIAPEGFAELGILRLAHARAIDRSDHDALSSLAATFAGLGAGRLAVESAAEAAVGAARSGSTQAARRQAAEARRLADGCPGLATPSLSGAATLLAGATSPLTARERDVALRAAVGRSNRDIAEDLTMSERTVESHLARCYDKLGVRSRTELAGLLAIGGE